MLTPRFLNSAVEERILSLSFNMHNTIDGRFCVDNVSNVASNCPSILRYSPILFSRVMQIINHGDTVKSQSTAAYTFNVFA